MSHCLPQLARKEPLQRLVFLGTFGTKMIAKPAQERACPAAHVSADRSLHLGPHDRKFSHHAHQFDAKFRRDRLRAEFLKKCGEARRAEETSTGHGAAFLGTSV